MINRNIFVLTCINFQSTWRGQVCLPFAVHFYRRSLFLWTKLWTIVSNFYELISHLMTCLDVNKCLEETKLSACFFAVLFNMFNFRYIRGFCSNILPKPLCSTILLAPICSSNLPTPLCNIILTIAFLPFYHLPCTVPFLGAFTVPVFWSSFIVPF